MKANETYISLDTAKLLKDCVIESKFLFILGINGEWEIYKGKDIEWIKKRGNTRNDLGVGGVIGSGIIKERLEKKGYTMSDLSLYYPAFTWQEILWEYSDKFLPNEYGYDFAILELLQEKKYEEADLYLRKHCILIK